MVHEEYWVAITREGAPPGGGFLMTRYFALTATACLPGLEAGDAVQLHTALGLPLKAQVIEVAEDVGLALLSLQPSPQTDYPTPQADHAVRGEAWYAPYRPGPTVALLTGTVDDVAARQRRDGNGCAVSVIELSSDRHPHGYEYGVYAGGPVERLTEDRETGPVLGILLEPEIAGRLRDSAEHRLAAGAIDSVMEVFPELTARNLLERLGARGRTRRVAPVPGTADACRAEQSSGIDVLRAEPSPGAELPRAEQSSGVDVLQAESPPWSGTLPEQDARVPEEVKRRIDTTWYVLRHVKAMADEGIVDPRDLPPLTVRMLNDIVDAASEEEGL
ncbi:hypothetical protein [Streptomyces sp. NPDC059010]|uniref:hypothetical protein n=1 Tax=Streptomyces sp. NPDC059010 TaxID=3346695 RepID=UPI00368F68F5